MIHQRSAACARDGLLRFARIPTLQREARLIESPPRPREGHGTTIIKKKGSPELPGRVEFQRHTISARNRSHADVRRPRRFRVRDLLCLQRRPFAGSQECVATATGTFNSPLQAGLPALNRLTRRKLHNEPLWPGCRRPFVGTTSAGDPQVDFDATAFAKPDHIGGRAGEILRLKRRTFPLSLALARFWGSPSGRRGRVVDGRTAGSVYRLVRPSNWNGILLLYAHGYVSKDARLPSRGFTARHLAGGVRARRRGIELIGNGGS